MEVDAELRRRIVVSVAAVGAFLAALVAIGLTYNGGDGLPSQGALTLVGLLVAFVLLMAAVGAYLARADGD